MHHLFERLHLVLPQDLLRVHLRQDLISVDTIGRGAKNESARLK